VRSNIALAVLLLAACGKAESIELQSSHTLHTSASDDQLTDRVRRLARELRTDVDTGQNGAGLYANFDVGSCHYAVQRFEDGRLEVDAYWYSERARARCDRAAPLKQFETVLAA